MRHEFFTSSDPKPALAGCPGLGDHYPADRRGSVGARVQRLPDPHPVLPQPRTKLFRGHAIRTRCAPVSPDTPQRLAQILGESIRSHNETFRQRWQHPWSAPTRRYASLRCSTELTVSSQQQTRVTRDGCDHCDRHEQHRLLRLTRRSVLPGPLPDPRPGTTTSADFCPVSHLAMQGRRRGATPAQPTPRQIPLDKNDQFPSTPAARLSRPSWIFRRRSLA
jgi:hypothetical protein